MEIKNSEEVSNNFDEALKKYYKLKTDYDMKYRDKKRIIAKSEVLTTKEKRAKIEQIKMKCIGCNKNGGTLFTNKNGILKAVCGNLNNQCDLRIEINRGRYMNLEELIDAFSSGVDENKTNIIKLKLNLLFGYDNEEDVLHLFEKEKEDLTISLELLIKDKESFLNIVNRLEEEPEIKLIKLDIHNQIVQMKQNMIEFKESNNMKIIKDIVTNYNNELIPVIHKLRDLQYKYMNMEYNETDKTYHLIQKKYSTSELEIEDDAPSVIEFSIDL